MCCWNENPRSFQELLCRLLYYGRQQHNWSNVHFSFRRHHRNWDEWALCICESLLDFLSWWWKGRLLMKLRSLLDKQPILSCWLVTRRCVGITRRRSCPFLFCCCFAWIIIRFSFVGCPNFLLSFISFRDDRIMISVSDVETCSSGVRPAKDISHTSHNNNNIPARPAVGSDKANYYLLKDTQSDPVSPWHHFLLLRPPPTDSMYYNYIIWHRRHGSSVSTLFSFN